MTTAQSSYRIAMALDDLASAIGDTNAYDILNWLVGTEISEEDAGEVRRKLDEMRDFMGLVKELRLLREWLRLNHEEAHQDNDQGNRKGE